MESTQNAPEEWRAVAGYEGFYEVSNIGRVRSLDRVTVDVTGRKSFRAGRVMRPINARGYARVEFNKEGSAARVYVHRLVATAFLPGSGEGLYLRHLDDDRMNNVVSNLAWGTHTDNMRDVVRNGNHFNTNKTHCKHGHEFTEENTYRRGNGRWCRACKSAQNAAKYRRQTESPTTEQERIMTADREEAADLIAWNRDMAEWNREHGSIESAELHEATADALALSQPVQVEVTEAMVEKAARRMAQLDLPDDHTLDERLTVPWQRCKYEAEQVLEAALGGGDR